MSRVISNYFHLFSKKIGETKKPSYQPGFSIRWLWVQLGLSGIHHLMCLLDRFKMFRHLVQSVPGSACCEVFPPEQAFHVIRHTPFHIPYRGFYRRHSPFLAMETLPYHPELASRDLLFQRFQAKVKRCEKFSPCVSDIAQVRISALFPVRIRLMEDVIEALSVGIMHT